MRPTCVTAHRGALPNREGPEASRVKTNVKPRRWMAIQLGQDRRYNLPERVGEIATDWVTWRSPKSLRAYLVLELHGEQVSVCHCLDGLRSPALHFRRAHGSGAPWVCHGKDTSPWCTWLRGYPKATGWPPDVRSPKVSSGKCHSLLLCLPHSLPLFSL